jgi:hypothetical protein
MNIGDIVIVVENKSVPSHFHGHYGKIVDVHEYRVTVEFVASVGSYGSLSHTALPSDLKKVGEANN